MIILNDRRETFGIKIKHCHCYEDRHPCGISGRGHINIYIIKYEGCWSYTLNQHKIGEDSRLTEATVLKQGKMIKKHIGKAHHTSIETALEYINGLDSTAQQKVDAITEASIAFKKINALQEFENFKYQKYKEIEEKAQELELKAA